MEIRCSKCNKLFRVADEKITGKGIKFSCTQCGDAVKITREDLDAYTLSKTAVTALDMFEPKQKPDAISSLEPDAARTAEKASGRDATVDAQATLPASKDFDQSSSSTPDFLQEKEAHVFSEPNPPYEESPIEDTPQQEEQKHLNEVYPAIPSITSPNKPGSEQESGTSGGSEEKSKSESHPEAAIKPKSQEIIQSEHEQKQEQERKMTPALDLIPMPKPGQKSQSKSQEHVSQPHKPDMMPGIKSKPEPTPTDVPNEMPNEEPVEMVMGQIGREALQTKPSHTGRMVLILMSAIIMLGVAGYGVYKFVLPSMQNADRSATEMTSIDGLRIVNPSGSVESNGDLLITGAVENLTDKERSAWYVIVDVYDAKGTVLNRLRLLNGKQIYSHADYDVLSKRGVNVTELKANSIQSQGVVIPANGSVSFEIRYIQPPIGIASFNAVLQPYDPIRLLKDIAEESK
jgi:hypothetical protein